MDNRAKSQTLSITGILGSDTNIAFLPSFSMSIDEGIGLGLPVMSLSFQINYLQYAIDSIELDSTFTLTRDTEQTTWIIAHISMPDENHISIIAFMNGYDFIHKNNQSFTSGTSADALNSIQSLPINYSASASFADKMTWIQDNISDQDYAYNILLRSTAQNTNLITAVKSDGNLYITDYATLIKTPTFTFGGNNSDVSYHPITVETMPVSFRLKVMNSQFISKQSLYTDSYGSSNTGQLTNTYAVGIDCGNTYDGYEPAYNSNNTFYANLLNKLYCFIARDGYFARPLDVMAVQAYVDNSQNNQVNDTGGTNYATLSKLIGKNFVVVRTLTTVGADSVLTQRIWFARVPDANSST